MILQTTSRLSQLTSESAHTTNTITVDMNNVMKQTDTASQHDANLQTHTM